MAKGSEWAFDASKLQAMYGSVEGYRQAAGKAIIHQIQGRFLLPADAEILRRETVEAVQFS
jgi:hypothetical protein